MFEFTDSYFFRKRIKLIISLLFSANVLTWLAVFEACEPNFLEVNFFDVGQGDSIFIETPWHHQILIDGGPDNKVLEKLAQNMPFWDRTLDLVILTHPQRDHLGGLIEVLRRFKVENILWNGSPVESQTFNKWKQKLELEKGARIFIAKAGQQIKAGKFLFKVLFPIENVENKKLREPNQASIVLKGIFGKSKFIFTGDVPSKVELELVKEYSQELQANVLKVSHHGSKYSSHSGFLEKVSPQIAVISVGQNNYGHPAIEVIDRLLSYGVQVLRTDKEGDIKLLSNGQELILARKNQKSKL